MPRLLLINPNTDDAQTRAMTQLARQAVDAGTEITALTAPFGAKLIANEDALDEAARAVLALTPQIEHAAPDGVIVSAFGDPALGDLRQMLDIPVTGIAEAGMLAAARHGSFCVVTTTPALEAAIARKAHAYGHGERFMGSYFTSGDPHALMTDHETLTRSLATACEQAIAQTGCAAIVIGGGPLAMAARALSERFSAVLVEPVPEAARLARQRAMVRMSGKEPARVVSR